MQLGPQGIVVHHNAVVEHAHVVTHHGLVVGQAIGDQAAVAEHHAAVPHIQLAQEPGDAIVGPVNLVPAVIEQHQSAGVFAALLGVSHQLGKVVFVGLSWGDDAENSTHEINISKKQ